MKATTVKDLIEYLKTLDESMIIALRAKDDYLLTKDKISISEHGAYFGNCRNGSDWEDSNLKRNADGDPDYENMPACLIFDTERG